MARAPGQSEPVSALGVPFRSAMASSSASLPMPDSRDADEPEARERGAGLLHEGLRLGRVADVRAVRVDHGGEDDAGLEEQLGGVLARAS